MMITFSSWQSLLGASVYITSFLPCCTESVRNPLNAPQKYIPLLCLLFPPFCYHLSHYSLFSIRPRTCFSFCTPAPPPPSSHRSQNDLDNINWWWLHNIVSATEIVTLEWWFLCYGMFISIFRKVCVCINRDMSPAGGKTLQWFPAAPGIKFKFFTSRLLSLPDGPYNLTSLSRLLSSLAHWPSLCARILSSFLRTLAFPCLCFTQIHSVQRSPTTQYVFLHSHSQLKTIFLIEQKKREEFRKKLPHVLDTCQYIHIYPHILQCPLLPLWVNGPGAFSESSLCIRDSASSHILNIFPPAIIVSSIFPLCSIIPIST